PSTWRPCQPYAATPSSRPSTGACATKENPPRQHSSPSPESSSSSPTPWSAKTGPGPSNALDHQHRCSTKHSLVPLPISRWGGRGSEPPHLSKPIAGEAGAVGVDIRIPPGEQRNPLRRGLRPDPAAGQEGGAAGDALLAVDEGHRPRRGGCKLRLDQREMRAGEDDRVERLAALLPEQPVQDPRISLGVPGLAPQLRLGQVDQLRRSMAEHPAVAGEFGRQPVDIRLADRRLGAEHADRPAP